MFRTTNRLARSVAAVAVVALAVPATSVALDYRNPDSRPTSSVDLRSPDARDAGRVEQSPAPPEITKAPGFDWGDAGIGAGTVLGMLLIVLSTVYAVVHRRSRKEGPGGPALTS